MAELGKHRKTQWKDIEIAQPILFLSKHFSTKYLPLFLRSSQTSSPIL